MDDRIKSIALHIPLSILEVLKVVLSHFSYDTVAERLRRSTRNRLGSSRVGSSPACVAYGFCLFYFASSVGVLF